MVAVSPSTAVLLIAATPVVGVALLVLLYLAFSTAPRSGAITRAPRWFAERPNKKWGEQFFLIYSPFWILFVAIIVASGAFERFKHLEYMTVCVLMALPCILVPLILQPKAEQTLPLAQRYVGMWLVSECNHWLGVA